MLVAFNSTPVGGAEAYLDGFKNTWHSTLTIFKSCNANGISL
jgi:hypothetical protein